MGRRAGRLVALALLLPLAAGCGADFAVPRTAAECYAAAPNLEGHGYSDGVSGWNLAYSEDKRPLGSSVTLYICAPTEFPATVSVDAPPGVDVEPASIDVSGDPDEIGELEVTVTAEMEDTLYISFRDEAGGGGSTAVVIEANADEWSLTPR